MPHHNGRIAYPQVRAKRGMDAVAFAASCPMAAHLSHAAYPLFPPLDGEGGPAKPGRVGWSNKFSIGGEIAVSLFGPSGQPPPLIPPHKGEGKKESPHAAPFPISPPSLRAPTARGNPEPRTPALAALDRHGTARRAMPTNISIQARTAPDAGKAHPGFRRDAPSN